MNVLSVNGGKQNGVHRQARKTQGEELGGQYTG